MNSKGGHDVGAGLVPARIALQCRTGRDKPCPYDLYSHSLTSTKCPATAAAAAMAGLTRCVRPPVPCRPSKLRLLVEAQRSPGFSLSGFMARHMEQPDSRHSKPASTKILSRPSRSAACFTFCEPGTTSPWTCWEIL